MTTNKRTLLMKTLAREAEREGARGLPSEKIFALVRSALGGSPMSKIRHIALLANDPAALAAFYQKTFGMREVPGDGDGNAIFISDGYINLALIPARGRPEGIFHFGFEVENLEETAQVAVAGGATPPKRVPQDGRFNEAFIKDPVGTRVDLSEAGWKMA